MTKNSAIIDTGKLRYTYDRENEILHVSASEPLQIDTLESLETVLGYLLRYLEEHCQDQRVYLLIDLPKFRIDPALSSEFAAFVKSILEHFAYPNGIARYGYDIARITARAAYQSLGAGDPGFYSTHDEALAYLLSLRQQQLTGSRTD